MLDIKELRHNELSKSVNNIAARGEIEQKIIEFQEKLNSDPTNFSKHLKEFESYYFTMKPILT